jgi:predicted unusual protein kinase regulating ubiquinone biosynthesis (AarF/ABC1/UbiB family)
VAKNIARNLELLDALAGLVERWHPQADKIRPRDMFNEVAKTLHNELNLQNEGANASLLRRNFENSDDLYVPEIFWSHTGEKVLTMERVHGIPADDVAALDKAGIDRRVLAEKGVRLFYEQVFRDNFFHADAHPGNIWVDPTRTRDPRFIALDFGIMVRCRTRTSTGSRKTSSRCSSAITGASRNCIWPLAGCRATSAWMNWKPRSAPCANRISRVRFRKFHWPKSWRNCSAPRAGSN